MTNPKSLRAAYLAGAMAAIITIARDKREQQSRRRKPVRKPKR
ncbi:MULTISPECIES: hypothetical protein [unclassified Bradyrhizobium]